MILVIIFLKFGDDLTFLDGAMTYCSKQAVPVVKAIAAYYPVHVGRGHYVR